MSEVKIQAAPAADGAQEPLALDQRDLKSTHGSNFSQDTMSICRGAEVTSGSSPIASRNGLSNGLGVTGVRVGVKPVDRRTIEGSYAGDSRVVGAPAALPGNPGVRVLMSQAPNGKHRR